jgi:glycogen(starch) synthase
MRILFLTESFWPYIGGVGVMAGKLLPELRERGHEFRVVTPHDYLDLPDEDDFDGIPILRLNLLEALRARDLERLGEITQRVILEKRRFCPDLVHLNSVGLNAWLHLQTDRVCNVPTLASIHQLPLESASENDTLQGRSLRSADWVTCCSEELLETVCKRIPELCTRSCVIYNGLPAPAGAPCEAKSEIELLCVGRLVPEKGFDLALDAFGKLLTRYPDARLVLVGDGPEREALERRAEGLGIRDRVEFLGWTPPDSIPERMNRASLVLMPSRREGLPLVAIEASLAGLPIVATKVGGLPEVIDAGRTGLLVPPEDSTALSTAMVSILEDPTKARAMGEAARGRALERFDLEAQGDSYDGLYRRLTVSARP